MGCVPPQRKQNAPAAASTAIKKSQSLRQLDKASKQSSNSIENNNFKSIHEHQVQHIVNRRQIRRNSPIKSSPRFKTIKTLPENSHTQGDRVQYPRGIHQAQTLQHLALPPSQKDIKSGELSKIISVHSLDLNSNIKIPESSHKTLSKKNTEPAPAVRQEQINITFNNNNFATASSKNAGGLGMGRRWREEVLREELRNINEENFKKIKVGSFPVNE